jgi:hypothetical protein
MYNGYMTYNHETDTDNTPAFTADIFLNTDTDCVICVPCARDSKYANLTPYTYTYDSQTYAFDLLCEYCLIPIYETLNA